MSNLEDISPTIPVIPGYDHLAPLGRGGMADVYLARSSGEDGHQGLVAIKVARAELLEQPGFAALFLREAAIALRFRHPNIVRVLDAGHAPPHLVMEYVHGRSLRELLGRATARGGLPISSGLYVVKALADALHHVHGQRDDVHRSLGLVHRDVSPSNALIGFDGSVKLTDFGIAKATGRRQTTIGSRLKGKVGYMSPEQCRCEPLDCRADIFCLGILLYEVTLGRRLFCAPNDFAVFGQILRGEFARPRALDPNYPPELEQIVLRALQSEPDFRHQTAAELAEAIASFARDRSLIEGKDRLAALMSRWMPDTERTPSLVGWDCSSTDFVPTRRLGSSPGTMNRQHDDGIAVPRVLIDEPPRRLITQGSREPFSAAGAVWTQILKSRGAAALLGALILLSLLAACSSDSIFRCSSDAQCSTPEIEGTCSSPGYCSFRDPSCASGLAFGEHADPALARDCVEPLPGQASGDGSDESGGPGIDPFEPDFTTGTTASDSGGDADGSTGGTADDDGGNAGGTGVGGMEVDPPEDGLVLWISFDEDPSEENGVADHGPYMLDPYCADGHCPSSIPGPVGNAALFDGDNDVMAIHDDSVLEPESELTIAFWARLNVESADGYRCTICKPVGTENRNSYQLGHKGGTDPEIKFSIDKTGTHKLLVPSPFVPATWIHVAAVWDGEETRLYFAGELAGSAPGPEPSYGSLPLLIGADADYNIVDHFWSGGLDEIRLYDRALSEDEILVLAKET